jgi:hypothetical protein
MAKLIRMYTFVTIHCHTAIMSMLMHTLIEIIFHTSVIIDSTGIKMYDHIFPDPGQTIHFTLESFCLTNLFTPSGPCTKMCMFSCSQLQFTVSISLLAAESSVNMRDHFVKDTAFIN